MALPLAMPQRVRIGRRSQLRLEIQGCDGAPVILLSHYQLCVVSLYMMHCTVLYVSFIENVHLRMPFVSELGLGFWCRKTTLSCVIFLKLFSNVCLPVDSLIPLTLSLSLGHSFLSGVENTESFWLILREPYRANHYQISGRGNWPPKCILPVVSQIF